MNSEVLELRHYLHEIPELSGQEFKTRAAIKHFLEENTSLQVKQVGNALIAEHIENENYLYVGFRADMDAVPDRAGHARHACGHDGHSSILCAFALEIEGKCFGKNIVLIFQSAEETGQGAAEICLQWEGLNKLSAVYGLHNIPGYPAGELLYRKGCFACASCGYIVRMKGSPAHAAYPGDGVNPIPALCEIVSALPTIIQGILGDKKGEILMATLIGLRAGSENFGVSASEGELLLTLRATDSNNLEALRDAVHDLALRSGIPSQFECRDDFPATVSDTVLTENAVNRWESDGLHCTCLAEPMRWSEDFGQYLKHVPGVFFGIGSGEDCAGLHTDDYVFNDVIIPYAVRAFKNLL